MVTGDGDGQGGTDRDRRMVDTLGATVRDPDDSFLGFENSVDRLVRRVAAAGKLSGDPFVQHVVADRFIGGADGPELTFQVLADQEVVSTQAGGSLKRDVHFLQRGAPLGSIPTASAGGVARRFA